MLDKIPPDRRLYLLIAAGIGIGGGYLLTGTEPRGLFVGFGIAAACVAIILNAASGGDMNALLNALRGASEGMRPARPLGITPQETVVYDALDSLAQRLSALESKASNSERSSEDRKGELERLRSEIDR
jgi:hypothetical protein